MEPAAAKYILGIGILAAFPYAWADSAEVDDGNGNHNFHVSSTTFAEGGTLPLSMVWDQCSNYPGGSNRSPELSWSHAPRGTRSLVVIGYDITASFTHWAMYNISPRASGLPENAGVVGSTYGTQVLNDFFIDQNYDGPCPPTTLNPTSHHYVFTVYALDTVLPQIPTIGDFTPGPEALYQALIAASLGGHILDRATTGGFFGTGH
jgi:Raf kinase inhibitor-like YbhB/YbcL family protein